MESDNCELYKYIGKNIKTLRKINKLSLDDLAQSANVSPGTIRNMESGAPASLPVLLDVSKCLGVPFDSLIYDYTIHDMDANVNSVDLAVFIEAYQNATLTERERMMDIIKVFLKEF